MAISIPGPSNEESPIVFVDFNQDFTSLCVGTRCGYSLLSTENNQVVETFSVNGDPMCYVGRLFTSNLVTLVSLNDMRKLLIFHYRRNSLICDYRYSNTILAVRMNRQRLIVCLENEIFIHNIRDMEMLHRIEDTPSNKNGVVAFSSCPDKCYLAYPGSNRAGTVFIFDALNFTNVSSIAAHDGPLAAISFNGSSKMLATASERGTVVRVFSIPDGDKLMEFRRGLARCACICSLNFSTDDHFLVTASNTETVHIFKLDGSSSTHSPSDGTVAEPEAIAGAGVEQQLQAFGDGTVAGGAGTWTGWAVNWMGGVLKAGAGYLPHQVSEVFSQDRSFAFAWIPTPGQGGPPAAPGRVGVDGAGDTAVGQPPGTVLGFKKVAALTSFQGQYRLLVAGVDGLLHIFSFDPLRGGEASLIKTQSLIVAGNHPAANSPVSPLTSATPTPPPPFGSRSADTPASPSQTQPQSRHTFASAVVGEVNISGQDLMSAEVFHAGSSSTPKPPHYDKEFPAIATKNNTATTTTPKKR